MTLWARKWLMRRDRQQLGHYSQLVRELEDEDPVSYKKFTCHKPYFLQELVNRVGPRIGRYTKTQCLLFVWPLNTISGVVKQVCEAIVEEDREVICISTKPEGWKAKAYLFIVKVSPCYWCAGR